MAYADEKCIWKMVTYGTLEMGRGEVVWWEFVAGRGRMKNRIKTEILAIALALVAASLVLGCSVITVNKNIYNLVSGKGVATTTYTTTSDTDAAAELQSKIDAKLK